MIPLPPDALLVHGTAVALDGRAALLRGPSGIGKSDLALRLIDRGGRLVADDQCVLQRDGGRIVVRSPETIAGLLEIRGIGIVRVDHLAQSELAIVVDLVATGGVERLPPDRVEPLLGLAIPLISLAPQEASSPIKLAFVLRNLARSERPAILGQ